jgi:PBP1b-binding outer membrane lipoprotein LpoB
MKAFHFIGPSTILSLALLICVSCRQSQPQNSETPATEQPTVTYNPYADSEITVEVFKVDSVENNGSTGWGYDVMINGKLYIHQPNIPAVMGNNGFSSEEKARAAGELIVTKIRKNILPPTVTVDELENMGLLE